MTIFADISNWCSTRQNYCCVGQSKLQLFSLAQQFVYEILPRIVRWSCAAEVFPDDRCEKWLQKRLNRPLFQHPEMLWGNTSSLRGENHSPPSVSKETYIYKYKFNIFTSLDNGQINVDADELTN